MEEISEARSYFNGSSWKLELWGGGSWCGWKEPNPQAGPGSPQAGPGSPRAGSEPPQPRGRKRLPVSVWEWDPQAGAAVPAALLPGRPPGSPHGCGCGECQDPVKSLLPLNPKRARPALPQHCRHQRGLCCGPCYSPGSRAAISSWSVEKKHVWLSL